MVAENHPSPSASCWRFSPLANRHARKKNPGRRTYSELYTKYFGGSVRPPPGTAPPRAVHGRPPTFTISGGAGPNKALVRRANDLADSGGPGSIKVNPSPSSTKSINKRRIHQLSWFKQPQRDQCRRTHPGPFPEGQRMQILKLGMGPARLPTLTGGAVPAACFDRGAFQEPPLGKGSGRSRAIHPTRAFARRADPINAALFHSGAARIVHQLLRAVRNGGGHLEAGPELRRLVSVRRSIPPRLGYRFPPSTRAAGWRGGRKIESK